MQKMSIMQTMLTNRMDFFCLSQTTRINRSSEGLARQHKCDVQIYVYEYVHIHLYVHTWVAVFIIDSMRCRPQAAQVSISLESLVVDADAHLRLRRLVQVNEVLARLLLAKNTRTAILLTGGT